MEVRHRNGCFLLRRTYLRAENSRTGESLGLSNETESAPLVGSNPQSRPPSSLPYLPHTPSNLLKQWKKVFFFILNFKLNGDFRFAEDGKQGKVFPAFPETFLIYHYFCVKSHFSTFQSGPVRIRMGMKIDLQVPGHRPFSFPSSLAGRGATYRQNFQLPFVGWKKNFGEKRVWPSRVTNSSAAHHGE